MSAPSLLGRMEGDRCCDVRAFPEFHSAVSVATDMGGGITITRFDSPDDCDRGGVVLRFEGMDNDNHGLFIPSCTVTPTGVDLHIAGTAEAKALMKALAALVNIK